MDDPVTPEEKEAYLKRNASLVWNVGTILEDRRDHVDADVVRIWDYLYQAVDSIYEQIGPTIDRAEDAIFGDFPKDEPEEEEEGIPYSKLKAFEKIVISYHGSNDEGWIEDIQPEPAIEGVTISPELYSEVEQEAYNILEKLYAGWEINEGSQGHLTIDVKNRTVFLHHGTNREVTDWFDTVIS